jgi:hypothetical protein
LQKVFPFKYLSFVDQVFIIFSCFFQNPFWITFLAPKAPIFASVLGALSDFQCAEIDLQNTCFCEDGRKRCSSLFPALHLRADVVFLKPYESLSRWDLRLLNTSFLDASLLIFCISSFSFAFIFAYFLHLHFNKTPVNVQPLSPSFFNEIATHSTNFRIFGLFYVRLCFSVCLLFLLILRPPKTYKITILDRFGIDLL